MRIDARRSRGRYPALEGRRSAGRQEVVKRSRNRVFRERGILEMVRTGKVALVRGSKADVKTRAADLEQDARGNGNQPNA